MKKINHFTSKKSVIYAKKQICANDKKYYKVRHHCRNTRNIEKMIFAI